MRENVKNRCELLASLCILIILLDGVNWYILGGRLNEYGIVPRQLTALPYILSAPFLHASWGHLLSNLFGLVIFGGLCLLRGTRFFLKSSLTIILLEGILVWMFGRSAIHIGASGWIFGLWSLSIALAWFERSFRNIMIAVFVVVFYGGMIYGVLPSDPHVSFESHLFGLLAGIVAAYWGAKKTNKRHNRRGIR